MFGKETAWLAGASTVLCMLLHACTCGYGNNRSANHVFGENCFFFMWVCVCVRVQCSVLRMILLMMVAICLNGCVVVEQPHSSFFEFYPRFRELVMMIQQCNGAVPWPAASPIPFAISRSCQSKLRKLLVWCTLQPKLGSQAVWNHAVWDTRTQEDFIWLHP